MFRDAIDIIAVIVTIDIIAAIAAIDTIVAIAAIEIIRVVCFSTFNFQLSTCHVFFASVRVIFWLRFLQLLALHKVCRFRRNG